MNIQNEGIWDSASGADHTVRYERLVAIGVYGISKGLH